MSTSTGPAPLPRSSTRQWQATTRVSKVGHALRDRPVAVRYRDCDRNAKSQTATDGRNCKTQRLIGAGLYSAEQEIRRSIGNRDSGREPGAGGLRANWGFGILKTSKPPLVHLL